MSYLRDEFLEFCALSEFVITDVQNQVIDSIFSNFEEQKNQNVIMPNAGGKTNLTYLLSAFFASENNKVLAYTSEPSHSVNDQIPGQMPFINNVLNWLKLVSIKNPTNITFDNNSYDYIFIDVLSAYDFETINKDSFSDWLYDTTTKNHANFDNYRPSFKELAWIGYNSIKRIIKNSNARVVIFSNTENTKLLNDALESYATINITGNYYFDSPYKTTIPKSIYGPKDIENTILIVSKNYNTRLKNLNKKQRLYLDRQFKTTDSKIDEMHFDISQKLASIELKLDSLKNVTNDIGYEMISVDSKIDNIDSKINDIYYKLAESHNSILSIQQSIGECKNKIALFEELVPITENKLEEAIKEITDNIMNDINILSKTNTYQNFETLLKIKMGENAWNKLQEKSKKFLISAQYNFSENMVLGDNIDYSSICILVTKAFEYEISLRFINGYKDFVKSKVGNDLGKWPSELVVITKNGRKYEKSIDSFTLGNSSFLMGFLPKNDNQANKNKDCFRSYCANTLFTNEAKKNIDLLLKKFDAQIYNIKENYRNPAAHKNNVTMTTASECINYILDVEKVLKNMLECFNF